jgi:Flp pilus assembly pilin Flp
LVAGLVFSLLANATAQLAPKLTAAFTNIGTTLTKHAVGT